MPVTTDAAALTDLRVRLDAVARDLEAAAHSAALAAATARAGDPHTARPFAAYEVARVTDVERAARDLVVTTAGLAAVVAAACPHDPREPRPALIRATHPFGCGTRGGWLANGSLGLVSPEEGIALTSGGIAAYVTV